MSKTRDRGQGQAQRGFGKYIGLDITVCVPRLDLDDLYLTQGRLSWEDIMRGLRGGVVGS